MKTTAACIAVGLSLAYGGFYGSAVACFVLAYINDNVRRRRA